MGIVSSKIIQSDEGQILLLPPEVAYGDDVELTIVRSGDTLTMYPTRPAAEGLSVEEMLERPSALAAPAAVEVREAESLPERPEM